MDTTIRKNEVCTIGLPRCDFVFSSTRSCFIAYGFEESTLEMTLMRKLLEEKGVQAVAAGGMRAPAQNAFCAKICSKIITSQFCIVLLNNDCKEGHELPNANVNMEYGLMLGFSKYVIPFQRDGQSLPFNIAGLDTIKYTNRNLEQLANEAIDEAIAATTQDAVPKIAIDDVLQSYLLTKRMLFARIDTEGDKAVFDIGAAVGFNLVHDFTGLQYTFLGNFTAFRPEVVLWRIRILHEIIEGRKSTFDLREKVGMLTGVQKIVADAIFQSFNILVIVNSDEDKEAVKKALNQQSVGRSVEVLSRDDIYRAMQQFGGTKP